MPAIFSSIYLLKPWMSETTVTNAVTPTIIPKRVRAERSLCAQIAARATFKISMSFTVIDYTGEDAIWLLASVRTGSGSNRISGRKGDCGFRLDKVAMDPVATAPGSDNLFPTQRFNRVKPGCFPCGP